MIVDYSDPLIVQEVSPRDGLQIEPTWVETADKIRLIDQLSWPVFRASRPAPLSRPRRFPRYGMVNRCSRGFAVAPG